MGIGDWGIGDWGLGIGPNPQSPITISKNLEIKNFSFIINLIYNNIN